MLSQALRRLQRPGVPMPGIAFGGLGSALRSARLADLPPELVAFLTYGRGVDTTRMHQELGFEPRYSTAEAFGEFASTLPPTGGRTDRLLAAVAERLPEVPDHAGGRAPALTLAGGTDG
jgi:UDP-glucose 4-epimerase